MNGGLWMVRAAVCGVALMMVGGCVSLDKYQRSQSQNRRVAAEKVAVATELGDERGVTDSLRVRIQSMEGELKSKDDVIANLRRESDSLQEMLEIAKAAVEGAANQARLSPISIAARLPAPLDSAIKRFAEQHPGEVIYDAANGNVKWKADLLFPLGSDAVSDKAKEGLREFTEIIKSQAAAEFEAIVVGHTDDKPIKAAGTRASHPTNWHLSAHRAISVSRVLLDYGYPADRVGVMGCGEYRPVASNAIDTGASQNRRVEIYLVRRGSITSSPTATSGIIPARELGSAERPARGTAPKAEAPTGESNTPRNEVPE